MKESPEPEEDITLLDAILYICSIFAILVFVVALIIIVFDRVPLHLSLIDELLEKGQESPAKIIEERENYFFLEIPNADPMERHLFLYKKHYSLSQRKALQPGLEIQVLYLSEGVNAQNALIKEGIEDLRYNFYYLLDVLIAAFISWLILVKSPHMLYLGIEDKVKKYQRKT
ncbi:MAG: hypothetical protein AAFU64_16900 [Bacteroidota bacterium]